MADALPAPSDDLYGIPQEELDAINSRNEPSMFMAAEPTPFDMNEEAQDVPPPVKPKGFSGVDPRALEAMKKRLLAGGFKGVDPRAISAMKKRLGMDDVPEKSGEEQWAEQNPKTAGLNKITEGIAGAYGAVTGPIEAERTIFDPAQGIPLHQKLLGFASGRTQTATVLEGAASAGRAVVGAGEAVQKKIDEALPGRPDVRDEGMTPAYLAKKAIEKMSPGHQLMDVAGSLGDVIPQDRLGSFLAMFAAKKPQAKAAGAELPLERSPKELNPAITEKLKNEPPFKNEAARVRKEKAAMSDMVREKELNAELLGINEQRGKPLDTLLGDSVDFGNDAAMGSELKTSVVSNLKTNKGRIASADQFVSEQASGIRAEATRSGAIARELATELRGDIVPMSGDTPLDKILTKIGASDKGTLFMKKAPFAKATTVADLIQAEKDLRAMISSETDSAGRVSPKGAALIKLRTGLKEDIANHVFDANDRLKGATSKLKASLLDEWEAKDALADKKNLKPFSERSGKALDAFESAKEVADTANDLRLDKQIPKLKKQWKNFYETFDNKSIRSILSEENPEKIYELAKASEDSLMKVKAATKSDVYQPIGVFKDAKAKVITELLEGMNKLDKPSAKLDFLESVLKDKSGKEAMTKFLTDGDRAALRQMVALDYKEAAAYDELATIAKRFEDNTPQAARSKRLGELAQYGDRPGDAAAKTAWQLAKDTAGNTYGNMRGAAFLAGGLLLGVNYPVWGAALFASKLTTPLFAHMYFNSIGFRTAVNNFVAGPSAATMSAMTKIAYGSARAGDKANETK